MRDFPTIPKSVWALAFAAITLLGFLMLRRRLKMAPFS